MAFVQIEDMTGSVEVVVFNSTYARARALLVEDARRQGTRRHHKQQGETKLIALEVAAFEGGAGAASGHARSARRRPPRAGRRGSDFPGEAPLYSSTSHLARLKALELGPECVDPQPDFFASVRHLLGAAAIQ